MIFPQMNVHKEVERDSFFLQVDIDAFSPKKTTYEIVFRFWIWKGIKIASFVQD